MAMRRGYFAKFDTRFWSCPMNAVLKTVPHLDYVIADPSLADWGRRIGHPTA